MAQQNTMPHTAWPLRALPEVTMAGRFPMDDRHFAYAYRHDTHALHLHDYSGTVRIGRGAFALAPGDVTLSPAGVTSRYDLPAPGHHLCIHFRPVRAQGGVMQLPLHMSRDAQGGFVADRMAAVIRLRARGDNPPSRAAAAVELQGLLLQLARQAERRQRPPGRLDAAVDRIRRVLDDRFAEAWTVPALAALAGISQDYLARGFRRRFGETIPRYLLRRRIAHAHDLLVSTDLPVHRVGTRVGMPDPQHFNKQFRRLTGMSPTRARAGTADRHPGAYRGPVA